MRPCRLKMILASLALALASSSTPVAGHPWPSFRHDLSNTGRTGYTGPAVATLQWTFTAPRSGVATTAAIAADGTIYIGSGSDFRAQGDSTLYAVNPDGSAKWSLALDAGIFGSPAIAPDGTIFQTTLNGSLFSIADQQTHGAENWRLSPSGLVHSSATVAPDGTVYFGGLEFRLTAVSPAGALKWQYRTDWCLFSTPAIGPQGEIYFGSKDHHLYCLEDSASYGKLRWKAPTGTFYDGHLVDSSPARAPDGTLYVGTDPYGASGQAPVPVDTSFFAFRPDGSRKWSFPVNDGVESSPALASDGTIYFGSHNSKLYAVRDDGTHGTKLWEHATGGQIIGSPAIDGDGTIYVGSRDGVVHALRPDGSLKWSFPTDGDLQASPSLDARGVLYISTMNGTLYAIGEPGPDVAALDLDLPAVVPPGSTWIPNAVLRNLRAGSASCEVALRIAAPGRPAYADTVAVLGLSELTSRLVAFAPWTAAPETGVVYSATVTALLADDNNPENDVHATAVRTAAGPTGVPGAGPPAAGVRLEPCRPNPFNPVTTIGYELAREMRIRLAVYDLRGRLVSTLLEGTRPAGAGQAVWRGRDDRGLEVPSGTYLCRLSAEGGTATRLMTLVR